MNESVVLLPYPQELTWTDGWYDLKGGHDLEGLAVTRSLDAAVAHEQGYELTITADEIKVRAKTEAGLFYADQTLKQLLAQFPERLPTLVCKDWPDFEERGVMLDISRDKVPTMDTLYALIDMLASWKVNQFQLYTEHTFAYRNHKIVWGKASPVTAEEIQALDAFCQERHIELVPNQNSFGHMRRWLIHEPYRHLSECPDGCDTVWGYFDEPFSLCPTEPGSLELLQELFDELLPNFSSDQFNIGCDETVDLGNGRSKTLVEEKGVGQVYLEFLLKIYEEVKMRGKVMQFWGDIIMHHPELVADLPKDALALEWGYEADHPFDDHGEKFASSGIPFYVCPGTSSWNTVAGRTDNAIGNLVNAAENGLKHGAIGYLNTDWGDNGHWQPLPVSYLGFAFGAAVAWANTTNRELDVRKALDLFIFHDDAEVMGNLVYELGNVYQTPGVLIPNNSVLFWILQATPEEIRAKAENWDDDKTEGLYKTVTQIETIITELPSTRMRGSDAELIKREFQWIADMLTHACHRALWALGAEDERVIELAANAKRLLSEHEYIWQARNRPGGFVDSQARLEKTAQDYA